MPNGQQKETLPTGAEPFKPEIHTIWSQPFSFGRGGLNTFTPANELQPDQASVLTNVKTDLSGVQLVWGYTELGSAVGDTDKIVRRLVQYQELDNTTYGVAFTNDFIYFWDGTSWTKDTMAAAAATTFTGNWIDAAMVQDYLVFVGPGDDVMAWKHGTDIAPVATTGTAPANSHFVTSFADRVIVARTTANPQLIQWCISGNIANWSGTGSGNVSLVDTPGVGSGADHIMGLQVHGDFLVVYRRHSVWIGTRTGRPTPALQWQYRHGTGVLAERSIANAGSLGDFYLGRDDVYLYHPRMAAPVRVGTPIANDIFDNLNYSKTENAHATYNKDTQEYWLCIPISTNTYPTRAYVLDVLQYRSDEKLVWTRRDFTDNIAASGAMRTGSLTDSDSLIKTIFGTEVGEAFDSDSSDDTDDGTAITMEYQSPEFSLPDKYVKLSQIAIGYTSSALATINVASSIDGGTTWSDDKAYTLPASTAYRWAPIYLRGAFGQSVRFRVRSSDTDRPVFKSYRLGLQPRGVIRRSA